MPHAPARTVPPVAAPAFAGITLTFAGLVVSLTQTLVVPTVPELPDLLGTSTSGAAWAVTVTLIAAAVATPLMGRLGDLYGRRRTLLAALTLLIAGSVTAALGDTLAPLLVGRALQGLALGVIPLGIGILRDQLPAERRDVAFALMSASLGAGGALGLAVGALGADRFDPHALFWTSAALGAVAAVLVLVAVPESAGRTGGRFDLAGALGLTTGSGCLLLGISQGAERGWTDPVPLGLLAVALVVLPLWGLLQLRVRETLVDLRVGARGPVLLTSLASLAGGFSLFTIVSIGRSPATVGSAMGLVVLAAAASSVPLSKAKGPKATLMAGAVIVAAGHGLGAGGVAMDAGWDVVLVSCVVGAGIGLAYGAIPALITGSVTPARTSAAHGLDISLRFAGGVAASAVAGVVLDRTALMGAAAGAALLAFVLAAFLPGRRTAAAATSAAPVKEPDIKEPDIGAAVAVPLARAVAELISTVLGLAPGGPADGCLVRGRVLAAEQVPVGGAAVTLLSPGGRQVARTNTGDDGAYAVPVPGEGTYVLIASADGCRPQATTVVVGAEPVTYDVLLSGTTGLAGVVRSSNGGPVDGAVVVVTDARGDVQVTVRTDGAGEFSFAELVPGPVTLVVNSPKHRPLALPVEIGTTGITRVDLELRPGVQVRGAVRGAGVPLGGARVTLTDAVGNVVATATTGPDGTYAFADLDEGRYTVVATGYPPRSTVLDLGGRVQGAGGAMGVHDIDLAHDTE
ncbi:MFS transporter [Streptomyces antibioticus]|uniref:MFS transporter n=1 Tax=Streptomyces antibioticus TaxID=1890 RepID=UPI0033B8944B